MNGNIFTISMKGHSDFKIPIDCINNEFLDIELCTGLYKILVKYRVRIPLFFRPQILGKCIQYFEALH